MRPLSHIKVIELAGLAPVPLCGMILSDFGARVVRVDNHHQTAGLNNDVCLDRGKQSICLNLKDPRHQDVLRRLARSADVLLDPYRPGVLERLGLAPVAVLQRDNPRLIVARITGYGQPREGDSERVLDQKGQAGHDINYLAMSGLLSVLPGSGDASPTGTCPLPPINILADFAGGALTCAFGIVAALLRRELSGTGDIVDCSMTLGSAYLSSFIWRSRDMLKFIWPKPDQRGSNLLDGGAPFYRCYRTKDNKYVAVGALEPQFYFSLLKLLEIPESEACQYDYENWPRLSKRFSEIFVSRTQDEWIQGAKIYGDSCLTPVLQLDEAAELWKRSFFSSNGHFEPKPQPCLQSIDENNNELADRPEVGGDTTKVLLELGYSLDEIKIICENLSAKI